MNNYKHDKVNAVINQLDTLLKSGLILSLPTLEAYIQASVNPENNMIDYAYYIFDSVHHDYCLAIISTSLLHVMFSIGLSLSEVQNIQYSCVKFIPKAPRHHKTETYKTNYISALELTDIYDEYTIYDDYCMMESSVDDNPDPFHDTEYTTECTYSMVGDSIDRESMVDEPETLYNNMIDKVGTQ